MKKLLIILVTTLCITSCKQGNAELILPRSTGTANDVLVVLKGNDWESKVGDAVRNVLGEHQVGLPQPETLFSVTQIDPKGFSSFMKNNKSALVFQKGNSEKYTVAKNKYAKPQVIITVTAKDKPMRMMIPTTRFMKLINARRKV